MITCEFENGNKASLRHLVVHAIVVKDNKILLEKRAKGLLEAGKWCLPSGFVDRDETAEQAVLRELKEETGWTGKVLQLLRINTNPNRPHEDRQNIAIDYIVEPLELVGVGDNESTAVEWFPLDALPPVDTIAFDHHESIELYVTNSKPNLA
jgi:8-oxo-dGTP diphosphatase